MTAVPWSHMPEGWLAWIYPGPALSLQTQPASKREQCQLFVSSLVSPGCSLISSACRLLSSRLRSSGTSAPAPASFSQVLNRKAEACCLRKHSTYLKECFKEEVTDLKAASCCLVSVYVHHLYCHARDKQQPSSQQCWYAGLGVLQDKGCPWTQMSCRHQSRLTLDRINVWKGMKKTEVRLLLTCCCG